MVNSRQKGKVGEKLVKEFLERETPYTFEYTPGSGSGNIKGDLMIPKYKNAFCIEVKNYAEAPNFCASLVNKTNDFVQWWTKLQKQAPPQRPLLFFRYNRSKLFVATDIKPMNVEKYLDIPWLNCYIILAEEWIKKETITWLHLPVQTKTTI